MPFALHGMCSLYNNVVSDIRLAKETGYQGLEIHTEKLWRYIDAGFSATDLKSHLDSAEIEPTAIDIIGSVESISKATQRRVRQEAETLCSFASEIGAPTVQLNGFMSLEQLPIAENITITARNIRELANIGKEHGIRFQYEGAAWTPIARLEDYYRLHDAVGCDNFGFVLDTWHLWASRGATPEDVSKVDKKLIYNVHVSDGKRPDIDEPWPDEKELRGYVPGYGDIALQEWIDAIQSTGYDGYYSGEFLNDQLWESDHYEIAAAMLAGMKQFVGDN